MPKKIKKCFYKNLTFQKLIEAHYRARKSKKYKNEIIGFELSLETNITNLLNIIKNHRYCPGEYRVFTIKEPKERIIKALPYVDRIVHQWYIEEFIKPYIVPKFISTSYACIINRGTHKAAEKVQEYMRICKRNNERFWVLKCDIKKFFYQIDKKILFKIMKKYIADRELLNFTKSIIFDTNEQIGIPIGNYTSQYFANIYLNELDQFIKRNLHLKYYVRYMDDFIILLPNKNDCIKTKSTIKNFIKENLHLELNEKTRYYPDKMGVNFCGYRIFTTHKLLRKSSKTRIKRQIKKWNKLYKENKLNFKKLQLQYMSWLGHASHSNSYNLIRSLIQKGNFFYN